jgi:hypothetical protein
MAIAVIGGLIVSTVLSLIFVPSFYAVMDDLSHLTGRLFGRFFSKAEDESAWEPIHDEHATPGEATAEAMGRKMPPRLAAE